MSDLISSSSEHLSTCCYCGVGCGVKTTVVDNKIVALSGDEQHPANYGRLCVKGSSLHETQNFSDRLTAPQINGEEKTWDEALTYTAEKFKKIINEHGPNAVAFYLSGQLLTEDYYVANKLMKGFIGTSNVDTNSRLCMASAVVAHKRAFGEDIVPGCYEDLEQCELIILTGSNMAYTHPVVFQRIVAAKQKGNMKVVVIDPRRTPTCDIADLHLPLRPGSDAFLFNGLLNYLAQNKTLDENFINQHCNNFNDALTAAQTSSGSVEQTAELCELNNADTQQFFEWFANTAKTVTVFSQGINQSSSGVDKGNAIINCHLATGRIGKVGATPFSITGQPNAMGGREVGGLANQLAAHMNFGDAEALDKVQRFWGAPHIAHEEGLKAVDMFAAAKRGDIKAIWVMATNPVVSMPDADDIRAALRNCELVVVSECVANTDTAREAHVLLPSTTWGEKIGTVTNSERCISVQKGFLPAPALARHDWQIICDFAQKMGFTEAFNFNSPHQIFAEHAALSGFENNGTRGFDISKLSQINEQDFLNLQPTPWPINEASPQGTVRMFADNHFFTSNGRANLIAITPSLPKNPTQNQQVLVNTGRIRDQWHSMGRTGSAVKLVSHIEEPFVEVHPNTALKHQLKDGDIVKLHNDLGQYLGRIKLSENMRQQEVFAPIHWNSRFAKHARISSLVYPITDPLCGQPEFKHSPAYMEPLAVTWQGFMLTRDALNIDVDYWCKIPISEGHKYRLANAEKPESWQSFLKQQWPEVTDWVELSDSNGTHVKTAGFVDGIFVAYFASAGINSPKKLENNWLEQQFNTPIEQVNRLKILAGSAGAAMEDPGAIICSCFQVGEVAIGKAIAAGACSAAELGKQLKCGTNCGSCIPELNALISANQKQAAS